MKKFIYTSILVAFATMMLMASCTKLTTDDPAPPEPFAVELTQTSVLISVTMDGAVDYVATNYKDAVHVSLPSVENIILTDEYDPLSGKGVIHITTSRVFKSSVTAKILFNDGTDTVEKDIIIETRSSWSIEPDNPLNAIE